MSKEEIYAKLTETFRNVFMDDSIEIRPETYSADIEGWDSLMQMVLISEVEKEFGIKFIAKESCKMQNVGEMVEIILAKL